MSTVAKHNVTEVSNAKQMYQSLEARKANLDKAAKAMIAKMQKGITPEIASQAKKMIAACKKTKVDFNEKRSPVTKAMDRIKKQFTGLENDIQKHIDTMSNELKSYASKLAAEKEAEIRAAKMKQLQKEEENSAEREMELAIRNFVQDRADRLKQGIINSLATVTTENKREKERKLKNLDTELDDKLYNGFQFIKRSKFGADYTQLFYGLQIRLRTELRNNYREQIAEAKQNAILQIGNMAELSQSEKDAAVQKESEKAKIDSATEKELSTVKADLESEMRKADNLFDSIDSTGDSPTRKGFEIVVTEKVAYRMIVAFWFDNCFVDFKGNIENKSIGSMKNDLQRFAHKNEKFLECKGLEYVPVYKLD